MKFTHMSNSYFENFAGAIDGAMTAANKSRALLSKPSDLWSMCQEPLNYGQTRRASFPLDQYKERLTKKFFHVILCRMESGRYELVSYVA